MAQILTLFCIGVIAGFVNTVSGGGGMLTIPALMMTGISPIQALATNKLQSIGGCISATQYLIANKRFDFGKQKRTMCFVFIGALLGAIAVRQINTQLLQLLIPILTISACVYFIFMPSKEGKTQLYDSPWLFLVVITLMGFYDGFIGPCAGSFYIMTYLLLSPTNITNSAINSNFLNLTSTFSAFVFYVISGDIVWHLGFTMMMGSLIGSRIGARTIIAKGSKFIRPMIITLSFTMSCKLIYDLFQS